VLINPAQRLNTSVGFGDVVTHKNVDEHSCKRNAVLLEQFSHSHEMRQFILAVAREPYKTNPLHFSIVSGGKYGFIGVKSKHLLEYTLS
jgi:hypothetical protein